MGIMPNCDVENVISLFHRQKPVKYTLKEIRLQADDSRWVIYVDLSDGKYVIKIASNNFTTAERVNAWADLIEKYGKMDTTVHVYCSVKTKITQSVLHLKARNV